MLVERERWRSGGGLHARRTIPDGCGRRMLSSIRKVRNEAFPLFSSIDATSPPFPADKEGMAINPIDLSIATLTGQKPPEEPFDITEADTARIDLAKLFEGKEAQPSAPRATAEERDRLIGRVQSQKHWAFG